MGLDRAVLAAPAIPVVPAHPAVPVDPARPGVRVHQAARAHPASLYIIGVRVVPEGDVSQVAVGLSARFRAMARMSDRSERDVTEAGAWTTDRPAFARVDRPGVVSVVGAAADAVLNPNSRVFVNHGGFTGDANLSARTPEARALTIGRGGPVTASAGSTLPNVGATFGDGSSATLPPNFPNLRWEVRPQGLLPGQLGSLIPVSGGSLPGLPAGLHQLSATMPSAQASVPLTIR